MDDEPPPEVWEAVLSWGKRVGAKEGFADVELLCMAHVCRTLRVVTLREVAARDVPESVSRIPGAPTNGKKLALSRTPPQFFANLGSGRRARFCCACGGYGESRHAGLRGETLCVGCAGHTGVRFEEAKSGRCPFAFTYKSRALRSQTLSKDVEMLEAVEFLYVTNNYYRSGPPATLLYVGLAEMLNDQWEKCGRRFEKMDAAEYVAARRALLQKSRHFENLLGSLKGAHDAQKAAVNAEKAAVKKAEDDKKRQRQKEKKANAQARREKKQKHVHKAVESGKLEARHPGCTPLHPDTIVHADCVKQWSLSACTNAMAEEVAVRVSTALKAADERRKRLETNELYVRDLIERGKLKVHPDTMESDECRQIWLLQECSLDDAVAAAQRVSDRLEEEEEAKEIQRRLMQKKKERRKNRLTENEFERMCSTAWCPNLYASECQHKLCGACCMGCKRHK